MFLASLKKIDWVLFAIVVAIVLLGIISFAGINDRAGHIIERQLLFLGLGITVMLGVSMADYRIFKHNNSAALLIYGLSIVFLTIVFASSRVRGINGWIVFFNDYQFQPSEFAKLALLILLAKYFSQKHVHIYRIQHIVVSGIYAFIPAGLTFLQPDFGSMTVFVLLWLAMLLFSGMRIKHLVYLGLLVAVASLIAWFFVFEPYQKNRIVAFINPYADARGIGYNTIQSEATVGSGRVIGSMFDRSRSLVVLVPEAYTDFAFAAFAQKFGLVGVASMLALFGLLFWRMARIASRATNNFARLFILGFSIVIFVHFAINMGMNLGLLPITGIPLSFLSSGGSHLITLMIGLGIVQSIKIYT